MNVTTGQLPAVPTPPLARFTARVYLVALMAYMLLWPIARSAGPPALVALLGLGFVAMITARRMPIFWPAVCLAGISAFYIMLSYLDVLPHAWTRVYDPSVIPQQAVGSLALPFLIGGNICALREIAAMSSAARTRLIVGFVFFGTFITSWLLVGGGGLEEGAEASFISFLGLNTFFSSELVIVILFGVVIFRSGPTVAFLVIAFGILISTNFQPVLTLLMAAVLRLGWIGRAEALKIAAGLLLVTVISSGFANELQPLDPNSSIRAAFWHDAIGGYAESHGIGIGYGTEVIRDLYTLAGEDRAIAREGEDNFLLTGVHSSFFQTLLRLGTLGIVTLLVLTWRLLPSRNSAWAATPFECWLFLVLVLDMAVNVALESIAFSVGLTVGMAVLISRMGAAVVPRVPGATRALSQPSAS